MFYPTPATAIIRGQAIALGALIGVQLLVGIPLWFCVLVLICMAPLISISRARAKRVRLLEDTINTFMLALANSLKSVPSIGAALQAVLPIVRGPIHEEIDLALREMRVGSTLNQALVSLSARVKSRTVDTAMSAILIGLQVGGSLPAILENTAGTMREMGRLEGVVRSKTAEGRAQLWVLAVFPFVLCGGFEWASPGYFEPLQKTVVGYIIISIALSLWVTSILVARKIIAVDI
ncbi:MAG: hypothetical protein NVS3B20_15250 [Polyangiales bacterium]